jgi:hypothetical protein
VTYSGFKLFLCGIAGLVVTGLIVWITEYYTGTDYRPVQSIAAASRTGHGTNIIQGLAISLESTALPMALLSSPITRQASHSRRKTQTKAFSYQSTHWPLAKNGDTAWINSSFIICWRTSR